MDDTVRLNKYISASGFCSRRKADEWIASGKVWVNGEPASMGMRITMEDVVMVNGKRVTCEEPFKLYLFYKPKGYACTSHRGDASGIFRNFDLDADLRYVGRLDKDSEGLLLLTNDGTLGNEIARARNRHEKEYIVTVDQTVTEPFLKGMAKGVRIYDSNKEEWIVTRPCRVKKKSVDTFSIILTQGLNRQIRRMCEQFQYRVVALKRVRILNLELGELKPGQMRQITEEELEELKKRIQEKSGRETGDG